MIANLILIVNLFILEGLLSIDNAAVLAIMVKDLPLDQQNKALRYGIAGAYALRGLCLFFASFLINVWGLKILGGLYLLYLVYDAFKNKPDAIEETKDKADSKIYKWLSGLGISRLLSTIVLVEIMDLAFSIDNIFASVAISSTLWVTILGVFIGIAGMRFIASWFVGILNRYPSLEKSAFVVIGFLGAKLIMSGCASGFKIQWLINIFSNHATDLLFSLAMLVIFFIPFLSKNNRDEAKGTENKIPAADRSRASKNGWTA